LLLLDEPLTGLDAALRQAILQDLRAWNAAERIPIPLCDAQSRRSGRHRRNVSLRSSMAGFQESGAPRAVLDAPR